MASCRYLVTKFVRLKFIDILFVFYILFLSPDKKSFLTIIPCEPWNGIGNLVDSIYRLGIGGNIIGRTG